MKKIHLFALAMLAWGATFAQESPLISKEFWQEKPDEAKVKAELDKGFNFSQVVGTNDPIYLALSSDAPISVVKLLVDQPGVDLTRKIHEGRIYLHQAAYTSNAEATDYLIEKGSDLEFLDANGHTAMTFAGFQGKLTIPLVDVFLKHGVDIDKKYPEKLDATILLISVLYDHDLSLTDYLVKKGATINAVDNEGNSAFNHAAKSGDVELMKQLAKRGVKYNDNALILAAQSTYRTSNTVEVHKYLVDEIGISPKQETEDGENMLHLVTKKQKQAEVIAFYLSKGIDGAKLDKDGNTPFLNAAGAKDFEVISLLYPSIKDINATNAEGVSPLMAAVAGSTGEAVAFMLEKGAEASVKDKEGNSLVYYLAESFRTGGRGGRGGGDAAIKDFTAKVDALKNSGLDLTAAQGDGSTLYHYLAEKNNLEVLKAVKDLGIDVNATNKDGLTALHKAAMVSQDDKTLKYLISIGANKDIATGFEETAYLLAKDNEQLNQNNVSVEFLK